MHSHSHSLDDTAAGSFTHAPSSSSSSSSTSASYNRSKTPPGVYRISNNLSVREELFNLDSRKLKKLEKIIQRSQMGKKGARKQEFDPSLNKDEIRMLKVEALSLKTNEAYRANRVKTSRASLRWFVSQYCNWGRVSIEARG